MKKSLLTTDLNGVKTVEWQPLDPKQDQRALLEMMSTVDGKLDGVVLAGQSLAETKAPKITLTNSKVFQADTSNADFSGGTFDKTQWLEIRGSDTKFVGASLEEGKFHSVGVSGLDFTDAKAAKIEFIHKVEHSAMRLDEVKFVRTQMPGAKMDWVNIERGDLTEVNLEEGYVRANFKQTRMHRAKLRKADMQGSGFDHVWAEEADFSGANMRRVYGNVLNLEKADLTGSDWTLAQATWGFNCQKAKLNKGKFNGIDASGGGFEKCEMEGAQFNPAELGEEDKSWMSLRKKSFQDKDGIFYQRANLDRANFYRAKASRAQFINANIENTNFYGAELHYAVFDYALGDHANFSHVYGRPVSFQHARLRYADFTHAQLYHAQFADADLRGAFFMHASLTGSGGEQTSFLRADLRGANFENASICGNLIFDEADMRGMNLRGTCPQLISVRGAKIDAGNLLYIYLSSGKSLGIEQRMDPEMLKKAEEYLQHFEEKNPNWKKLGHTSYRGEEIRYDAIMAWAKKYHSREYNNIARGEAHTNEYRRQSETQAEITEIKVATGPEIHDSVAVKTIPAPKEKTIYPLPSHVAASVAVPRRMVSDSSVQMITSLHRGAMAQIDLFHRKGTELQAMKISDKEARRHATLAFEMESMALGMAEERPQDPKDPTTNVLLRSAAALAVDARKYDAAAELVTRGLGRKMPSEIRAELVEVATKPQVMRLMKPELRQTIRKEAAMARH